MSLLVVAHGISRSAACGILVSQPGIKPASPALDDKFFFFFNTILFYLFFLPFKKFLIGD